MTQPSNKKLIEFIQNSSVSRLTSGGVNNICILLVENNVRTYVSKYEGYDFDTNTIIPLTKLCIKLVFISGGRKIEYEGKTSISEPLIRQEAKNQNIVFKKSIEHYGRPLCPPVLSINISKGMRIDILSAILSRMKRDTYENRKIYKDIATFIKNKKEYPIGFISMGYIPPSYKTVNNWIKYLQPLSLTLSKETFYIIFKELFKFHYLDFQHCDFNPDNIMICNPIVSDLTLKGQGKYTDYEEKLFRDKIKDLKAAYLQTFSTHIEASSILDRMCPNTQCIIIDFGTLRSSVYNPDISIYDNLKCQDEDELLLKIYLQKSGDDPKNISTYIQRNTVLNPKNNSTVESLTINNSKDKLNVLNVPMCEEYITRQKALHDLVLKIPDDRPELGRGVLEQLEKLSAPVEPNAVEPNANNRPPAGFFGNNNDFGGGTRKTTLQAYMKTLTYDFNKSTKQTRRKR